MDKSLAGTDAILADCDRLGIRLMTMQDAAYPRRLLAIAQPPSVLYWKGKEPSLDDEAAVAIVGAREATPYGEFMAGKLSSDLARSGAVIVSGMAQGIDAAAVRAALAADGQVVSVVANGLDVIYPRFHRDLYEEVTAKGTLLSEYPPGTQPLSRNFPVRNRILSGISVGVVLVESRISGGGLITARSALDQDREVFAVPGPANGSLSEGTNRLIQSGEAKLILSAEDVLCELVDRFPGRLLRKPPVSHFERTEPPEEKTAPAESVPSRRKAPEKALDKEPEEDYIDWQECREKFTEEQCRLLLALQDGTMGMDELSERTQIPVGAVLSALTLLQIQGMVAETEGSRYRSAFRLKME